jgi:hypothetical protein
MGWWQKWRERSAARAEARSRSQTPSQESPPKDLAQHVSVNSILDSIEKSRLEFAKLEWEHKIAELNATADERRDEREYQRKLKEKDRERKEKAAQTMREIRARGGVGGRKKSNVRSLPPFATSCEDCRAKADGRPRTHTADMIRHAEQRHDLLWAQADADAAS